MIHARLTAATRLNPALTPFTDVSDLAMLFQTNGTQQEALIEYAGRVCYRSTHRMGTAPDFIRLRIREGHEDIVEHIYASVEFTGNDVDRYQHMSRFADTLPLGSNRVVVGANLRTWRRLFVHGDAQEARPLIEPLAPSVFGVESTATGEDWVSRRFAEAEADLLPIEDGPMRVTLLAWCDGLLPHTTWLIEGVSRALTHQLVRHRLGSYSQESQRYVDLERGGWSAIVPPAIAADEQAEVILCEFWANAERAYSSLRTRGIRKEDARFLLPNAAETRLVASFADHAIWNFFDQRRDSAAQWEIRRMASHMYTLFMRRRVLES